MADLRPVPKSAPVVEGERTTETSATMALARAASQGDERATKELLDALTPRIARVVAVVLGSSHPDVDDVTQLALIAFTQALPRFRAECEPPHYASRIAVRTAVNARRRYWAMRARHDDMSDVETQETGSPTPQEDAMAERRRQIIRDLLAVIPPEQAEALALRVVLGWSLEEIAEAADAPLNTIKSRLRLAKEALRRKIEGDATMRDELGVDR